MKSPIFTRNTGLILGLALMCVPSVSAAWYMPYAMSQQGMMYPPQMYAYNQYQNLPAYSYAPAYAGYGGHMSAYQPTYSYAPIYPTQQAYYGPYNANGSVRYPYSYGTPTGDTVPIIGGALCYYSDYGGRAPCDSDPMQRIYDPWTGSWY